MSKKIDYYKNIDSTPTTVSNAILLRNTAVQKK